MSVRAILICTCGTICNRYVDYKKMKGLLKPLENFKGSLVQEAEFVSALYAEIEKVISRSCNYHLYNWQ
jgi:SPX domain protein involved in polyphosphate accumulation